MRRLLTILVALACGPAGADETTGVPEIVTVLRARSSASSMR